MISADAAREAYNKALAARNLTLTPGYFDALLKTANWLSAELQQGRRVLGVSGAQGTGKSTFSALLGDVLGTVGQKTLVLSLDDFYLTKAERRDLKSVHPMLETRGVPGTHDLDWCLQTVESFNTKQKATIPLFSKPEDDRSSERKVELAEYDLLIFEGWCWGARPQQPAELSGDVNELESELDATGHWRAYVNERLKEYQALFRADLNLMLKAPDFDSILGWRWQQEQGLPKGSASMTFAQVSRFIQYYQRITEQLLQVDDSQFDVTIQLDRDHCLMIDKFPA